MQLLAGEDILIAALADSSRTTSSSWGLSLGFAADGITFGADLSRTSGSSRMFTNAAVTAGGDLQNFNIRLIFPKRRLDNTALCKFVKPSLNVLICAFVGLFFERQNFITNLLPFS